MLNTFIYHVISLMPLIFDENKINKPDISPQFFLIFNFLVKHLKRYHNHAYLCMNFASNSTRLIAWSLFILERLRLKP